jgi:hypothetical protein
METCRRKSFVVLTQPRSGSYLLVDLLNQLPSVTCHGELFKPDRWELASSMARPDGWSIAARNKRPLKYCDFIYAHTPGFAIGFKLFPSQQWRVCRSLCKSRTVHKIVLTRDPLSRFLSRLRAEATGQWIHKHRTASSSRSRIIRVPLDSFLIRTPLSRFLSRLRAGVSRQWTHKHRTASGSRSRLIRIRFDPDQFEYFLQKHNSFVSFMTDAARDAPSNYTFVDYKHVVSCEAFERITKALGIPYMARGMVTARTRKQLIEPLQQLVDNYNDMLMFLRQHHPLLLEPALASSSLDAGYKGAIQGGLRYF